jgi:DNA-binding response OmpR family regulator
MYSHQRTTLPRQNGVDATLTHEGLAGLILVVEDDPDIQSLVAEHLMALGFDVCLAPDGEIAMQLIRERRPDVVCLDLNLPSISGYDVCEQIRADPASKDISILITSARNSLDVRVFSLEAGADAYLTKPYGMKQLTDEIERLFQLRAPNLARGTASTSTVAKSACGA